ncbi:MAG: 50S ribosomal protein L18e [Thaumarchaeota archaeon]|nr:50S ribosomal protein L18e [Nitrososphaerota archaeon]
MKQNEVRLKLGFQTEKHSKKSKQRIWKDVSEALLTSRKNRPVVNLADISRNSSDGSRVLVPGKVLGLGTIDHKVTIAAYSFSKDARSKIKASGGTCLGIGEFMESTPSVKDVLLLG